MIKEDGPEGLLPCPCCESVVTKRRSAPMTEAQCALGYEMCIVRGVTREQLLGEYVPTLDYIWPGFVTWLRERDR
jgi:hypothetical protein